MYSRIRLYVHCSILASVLVYPHLAAAQIVDAASVPTPAVVIDPKGEGLKYFYFYKKAVSFGNAKVDLSQCDRLTQRRGITTIPTFIPFGNAVRRAAVSTTNQYGLVGAILLPMFEESEESARIRARVRRCMETRGYQRQAITKDSFKLLTGLDYGASLEARAKLASSAGSLVK